jgi:hypothetical protein
MSPDSPLHTSQASVRVLSSYLITPTVAYEASPGDVYVIEASSSSRRSKVCCIRSIRLSPCHPEISDICACGPGHNEIA